MSTLALRVPLGEGESPASFCSRLALRNECLSATEFCRDMAMSFLEVVNGKLEALEKLADLGSADFKALSSVAFRRSAVGDFCGNETINKALLRRRKVRVCPACLVDDLTRWPNLGAMAPFGRSAWLLAPIRTCIKHDLELVEVIGNGPVASLPRLAQHDFARLIQPVLPELGRWVEAARPRKPTPLENYLGRRLQGLGQSEYRWLEEMPFYAVARACEMLGAVDVGGPTVAFTKLSEDDWRAAGGIGFSIMSSGPEGVRKMFDQLRDKVSPHSQVIGPKAIFGQLYNWFGHSTDDPVYEPLRELVRECTLQTVAMGPEEEILGRIVGKRRMHSVWSASLETDIPPKRLRKLLHAAGFISDVDLERTLGRAVFPADEKFSKFLAYIRDAMSHKEARAYINAPRAQMGLLIDGGFIKPIARGTLKNLYFAKRDLDRFLTQLFLDATESTETDNNLFSLPEAAKRARCSNTSALRLLLNRQLTHIRRKLSTSGYMSILVDPSEIRSFMHTEKDGLSIKEAAIRMCCSHDVVRALTVHGHLPSTTIQNPITRMRQRLLSSDDLTEFEHRYIQLHILAKERCRHLRPLSAELKAAGIRPVFDPKQVRAVFYSRNDLIT